MLSRFVACFALVSTAALFSTPEARACGGCFSPPTENTIVTGHRMALSISKTQTVLWDQFKYSGNPKEFSWVLPVLPGTKVELSRDEFFAALDAATQPVIVSPPPPQTSSGPGCGSSSASSFNAGGSPSDPGVKVVRQEVVGPYEVVTLSATDPTALTTWLSSHGYATPPSVKPVIDAYVKERFDFIALRLLPDQGVNAMKPVRVVMPGANPSLPLRMVAAGVGARVGLVLYVIAEGRYEAANFPNVSIDTAELRWDSAQNRSNYTELVEAALTGGDGRGWFTEFALPSAQRRSAARYGVFSAPYPTFEEAYIQTAPYFCVPDDAGPFPPLDADVDGDATADASSSPDSCTGDDIAVATKGMAASDVWITRLRADLPAASLTADLQLRAAAQVTNDAIYRASTPDSGDGCNAAGSTTDGAIAASALGALALVVARRRRR